MRAIEVQDAWALDARALDARREAKRHAQAMVLSAVEAQANEMRTIEMRAFEDRCLLVDALAFAERAIEVQDAWALEARREAKRHAQAMALSAVEARANEMQDA